MKGAAPRAGGPQRAARPRVRRRATRAGLLMGLALVLGSAAGAGCALVSKSEPLAPRYFDPEGSAPPRPPSPPPESRPSDGDTAGGPGGAGAGRRLRLGAVTASGEIRQGLAFRRSPHEVEYADTLRWTERPEASLRRALSRALFEGAGLERVVSGPGPTLDVELVAFEAVRDGPPRARASAVIVLHDERRTRLERTLLEEVVLPAGDLDHPEVVVSALGRALAQLVGEIAEAVGRGLEVPAAPPSGPAGG